MSAKNVDRHNRFRSITVGFRVSPEEQEELNRAVALSGLPKQEYESAIERNDLWHIFNPHRNKTHNRDDAR